MYWIKVAVLAVALSACGGAEKETQTSTGGEITDKKDESTAAGDVSCQQVVDHVMPILIEAGTGGLWVSAVEIKTSSTEAAAMAVKECKKANLTKESKGCMMGATTVEAIAKCEPEKTVEP